MYILQKYFNYLQCLVLSTFIPQISDKLCPDGLVFDESSIQFAKCSFPFSVSCEGRPELQKPKPTPKCPRQNGYFQHEDPTVRRFFVPLYN